MNTQAYSGMVVLAVFLILMLAACSDSEAPIAESPKKEASNESNTTDHSMETQRQKSSLADQWTKNVKLSGKAKIPEHDSAKEYAKASEEDSTTDAIDTALNTLENIVTEKPTSVSEAIAQVVDENVVKPKAKATRKMVEHEVQSGDTLYKIAKQYQLSVAELMANNDISDANQIFVGEVLDIK